MAHLRKVILAGIVEQQPYGVDKVTLHCYMKSHHVELDTSLFSFQIWCSMYFLVLCIKMDYTAVYESVEQEAFWVFNKSGSRHVYDKTQRDFST